MKANITTLLITTLIPTTKPYDVRNASLIGFIIRVNIKGKDPYNENICSKLSGSAKHLL